MPYFCMYMYIHHGTVYSPAKHLQDPCMYPHYSQPTRRSQLPPPCSRALQGTGQPRFGSIFGEGSSGVRGWGGRGLGLLLIINKYLGNKSNDETPRLPGRSILLLVRSATDSHRILNVFCHKKKTRASTELSITRTPCTPPPPANII